MQILTGTLAFVAIATTVVLASAPQAQARGELFIEGDIVRGAQQGAPGPVCV